MDANTRRGLDALERSGYTPALRELAMSMCAPFYWSAVVNGELKVLNNGTICYVDTGSKTLGVTADHVYRKYLEHLEVYPDIECQFGGNTIQPEKQLIDRHHHQDLATFSVPEVFVSAGHNNIHTPPQWPPPKLEKGEIVLYGGYPGVLREPGKGEITWPFETFIWRVTDITPHNLVMFVDFEHMHWPGHSHTQINQTLGGISGGPVFRVVERPISRLEIVGFIYEYHESMQAVMARHVDNVDAHGIIHPSK